MATKLKHVAIVSDRYSLVGRFYESLFGMRSSPEVSPHGAVAISDGYVGMNVIPRKPGRHAGFEHFGFEVDNLEEALARARELYPEIEFVKRPSDRPFASYSMHDPEGNVFDLSQEGYENVAMVYADIARAEQQFPRHIRHYALRSVEPQRLARFYSQVFELEEEEKAPDDSNYYFTDGRVTLVIHPWRITDYQMMGVEPRSLDHLGFEVESLEKFQADLKRIAGRNPALAPLSFGTEGEGRITLMKRCRYGQFHFCDPDGVLVDVSGPVS